ncbi:MAG: hypothetical protein JWL68_5641 [Actinomycetia bacterium]|nr:hypothetical protein [Actinomycetes bacterium]
MTRLRIQVNHELLFTGRQADELEQRIARLEEIEAAPWPRRIGVRRRLARDLRASVARYAWAGPDFTSRRPQAIGGGWSQR